MLAAVCVAKLTLTDSDPETQYYCVFLKNESLNPLLVLWAVMQPIWQTLPAQACSATVNEKWSSHPSWSAHCFPDECQKTFFCVQKSVLQRANKVEETKMDFS